MENQVRIDGKVFEPGDYFTYEAMEAKLGLIGICNELQVTSDAEMHAIGAIPMFFAGKFNRSSTNWIFPEVAYDVLADRLADDEERESE